MNKPLRNFSVTEYKPCYVVRRFLMILNLNIYKRRIFTDNVYILEEKQPSREF